MRPNDGARPWSYNLYYRRGERATNASFIQRVARLAAELDRRVATPGQARQILGVS
jgi:3-keto-5-aminohexanoate cleavage enzyme